MTAAQDIADVIRRHRPAVADPDQLAREWWEFGFQAHEVETWLHWRPDCPPSLAHYCVSVGVGPGDRRAEQLAAGWRG